MVYHSAYNGETGAQKACGCYILPLKGSARGPAAEFQGEGRDIVDEVLHYFRAVVLFRTYDVQGPGDKVLIYLTLYVSACLKKLEGVKDRAAGQKAIAAFEAGTFKIPGEAGFVLGGLMSSPASSKEGELFRSFLKQAREEVGRRLLDKCFLEDGSKNKFWMAFSHRKFMGKDMNRVIL